MILIMEKEAPRFIGRLPVSIVPLLTHLKTRLEELEHRILSELRLELDIRNYGWIEASKLENSRLLLCDSITRTINGLYDDIEKFMCSTGGRLYVGTESIVS